MTFLPLLSPSPLLPVLPVLYSFRRCPYAMRARLALDVSGQPYALREITLRCKPPELLLASAKGTVPVLVLPGGEVIDESLDIMQWALRGNDSQAWRRRGDDLLLFVIAINDGAFKHHLDRYKYPQRYAEESLQHQGRDFADLHRTAGSAWLTRLDALLMASPGKTWLFGHQPSLADMAIAPFVRQFAHTDATWFAAQPWPALQGWLARFEASALFVRVMAKHPLWESL